MFARTLGCEFLGLTKGDFELLLFACEFHSDGLTEADITIQVCWDADRLDLGRIGIRPDPGRLCTAVAKEPATIRWAYSRSRGRSFLQR